jgi:hypothetical protein
LCCGRKHSIAAVEGTVNAKERGKSFNVPATDQASVATSNINSAATRNTSFEDISPVPLVKRSKPTGRKNQRAWVLPSAELRMAILRKNEDVPKNRNQENKRGRSTNKCKGKKVVS